ncbi:MAG: hypothetical protein HC826_01190, partial [Rhodospirillales bacterium]|nr:hypothetical protein [Rhodospirillales bacterium]
MHWQLTLRFLQLLTVNWPRILAEEQAIDPALRRNQLPRFRVHKFHVVAVGEVAFLRRQHLEDDDFVLPESEILQRVDDPNNTLRLPSLVRLTPQGAVDTTFGDGGVVVIDFPWTTIHYDFTEPVHQPDGKVLFGGWCEDCAN